MLDLFLDLGNNSAYVDLCFLDLLSIYFYGEINLFHFSSSFHPTLY